MLKQRISVYQKTPVRVKTQPTENIYIDTIKGLGSKIHEELLQINK